MRSNAALQHNCTVIHVAIHSLIGYGLMRRWTPSPMAIEAYPRFAFTSAVFACEDWCLSSGKLLVTTGFSSRSFFTAGLSYGQLPVFETICYLSKYLSSRTLGWFTSRLLSWSTVNEINNKNAHAFTLFFIITCHNTYFSLMQFLDFLLVKRSLMLIQ